MTAWRPNVKRWDMAKSAWLTLNSSASFLPFLKFWEWVMPLTVAFDLILNNLKTQERKKVSRAIHYSLKQDLDVLYWKLILAIIIIINSIMKILYYLNLTKCEITS